MQEPRGRERRRAAAAKPAARALLAALCLLPVRSAAAETLVTDRPDYTESAETVPPGSAQLEAGYSFARAGAKREHACGEILLRVAMGGRAEVRLGLNSYVVSETPAGRRRDFDDPSVGVKLKLLHAEPAAWLPDVALLLGSTFRRGAESTRGAFEPEMKAALAWTLGPRLGLSANLGFADVEVGGELSGSASLALGLTESLGAYVELFGFRPTADGAAPSGYLDGGLTYLLGEDFQLDARGGVGTNGIHPDYFLGVGAARRW